MLRPILLLVLGMLAGPLPAAAQSAGADLIEGFNRSMFGFNEWIGLRYRPSFAAPDAPAPAPSLLPSVVRRQIGRMAANAQEPVSVAIDLVGGDLPWAVNNAVRFAVNTTLGVLGTQDVATGYGFRPSPTDIGLALCRAGFMAENPIYVVLPLAGPTTVRDFGGQVTVNLALWRSLGLPLYLGYLATTRLEAFVRRVAIVQELWGPAPAATPDPYAAQRSAALDARAQACAAPR